MKIKSRKIKKLQKLFKSESGIALPIVTLLMVFVLIGIATLVVDAGKLYGERRTMVSAADSAALAGSKVVEEALGTSDIIAAKSSAEKTARDIAVANGVKNPSDVVISWDRISYEGADRDVITVTVKSSVSLIFARLWGDDSSDVSAKAVATWGYVVSLEGGDIIPIFAKSSTYDKGGTTYLHSGKFVDDMSEIVNGNWGLIDIFGNGGDITRAFAGETINSNMELNYMIDNQTGLTAGKIAGIETRMQTANTLADKTDRARYMMGLVPIVNFSAAEEIEQYGSKLTLPIQEFVVFEIYDVIMEEGNPHGNKPSKGSRYSLYDGSENNLSDGTAISYPNVNGVPLAKSTIIGKFTTKRVTVRAVVEAGDQINPDPAIISAKYSKLIK